MKTKCIAHCIISNLRTLRQYMYIALSFMLQFLLIKKPEVGVNMMNRFCLSLACDAHC